MRVRIVLGSLVLASALGGGAWLAVHRGHLDPGLEGDAGAEEAAPLEASASTLAAHVRPSIVGAASKSARGRIEGEVRRAGAGVAARVTLFEAWTTDPGADPDWSPGGSRSRLPTEESLATEPVTGVDADASGRFVIDDVAAGAYDLVARSAEGGSGALRVVVPCDRALAIVRVELRGGGPEHLSGRVHHADGRPFRGFVAPGSEGAGFVAHEGTSVALDDDGRFTLAGLDPGPLCVIAYAPGSLFVRSQVVVVPSAVEFDLVVDAGLEEAKGRVVADKDGQPLAGAVVLTICWEAIGVAVVQARAVTDGEGRFRVPAMRGSTQYRVEASGFAPLAASRWLSAGSELEFRLERTGKVTGRVTSKVDGTPVEGVMVYVVDGDGEAGPHAVTKPDGRYEVADVAPGDVVVVACGAGWLSDGVSRATGRYNPFAVPLAAGAVATVDLVVARGARATGVVLDGTGKPAAGARVRAVRRLPGNTEDAVFGFLSEAQGVATGPDGRFTLETLIPGSSYEFHASSPNASEGTAGPLRVEADKPTEVELRLGAPRFADVVVRQKGGGPLAGVAVYASTTSDTDAWTERAHGNTAANGVVRLGPLPPGPLEFGTWSDEGYAADSTQGGGPDGSTDPIHVELAVDRRYAVAGTVRYADGTPLEGGQITLSSAGTARDNGWLGRNGSFRLTGVAPGAYDLDVKLEWGSESVLSVTVNAGDENLVLIVKAVPKERLDVTVLDADGKAVGRGSYQLFGEGQSDTGSFEEGRFHVGVRSDEWSVLVYGVRSPNGNVAPSGSVIAGPFPASARAQEIRLPPERRIEGVVRAPDGHGVRGVRVAAAFVGLPAPFAGVDEEVCSTRTDDGGRFRLGGLGGGNYRLRVSVGGGYGAIEPVEVAAGSTDVVLTLKVGDAVAPLVLDADGKPVVGVYLKASCPGTDSVSETDGEGRAALEGLDAGRVYALEIHVPSSRSDVLSRTIAEWKPTSDPIALPRGHRVAGVVRDADGRPVAGASVEAVASDGSTLSVVSRGNGAFELLRVPGGDVTLHAAEEGEPPRRSRPAKAAAGAADVVLVLERTTSLAVRLVTGRALPEDAQVSVHEENGDFDDWENAGADHVAVFPQLQPWTRYTFFADVQLEGGAHVVGIAKGVRGDAKTLTLELLEGRSVSGRLRFPPGTVDVGVWATTDGQVVGGEVEEDGRFVIHGLFEGPCVVGARGKLPGGEQAHASVKTSADAVVELELRADK